MNISKDKGRDLMKLVCTEERDDFFVKQGALTEIVNVDEYLHNNFDDKFIIRALRVACNSFFEYPIDAWAEYWERFYLDVSKNKTRWMGL